MNRHSSIISIAVSIIFIAVFMAEPFHQIFATGSIQDRRTQRRLFRVLSWYALNIQDNSRA